MPMLRSIPALACAASLASLAGPASAGMPRLHEATGFQLFTSPQVDPIVLTPDGSRLLVANTQSDSVSLIDTATRTPIAEIEVGMDPVSVAVRPDGREAWVANHVSDSVSVIDLDPASPTYLTVVATVQELDAQGATRFDEPTGIAFASNAKAYVALSSTNDIAVVDAATRAVTKRVHITAQDPRAIAVRGGRLYVAAFESNNQTELSECPDGGSPPQCTMDLDDIGDFIVQSPNIPGADTRIVIDPDVPDRDLFVFETDDEAPVATVSGVGTLLYGVAVDSTGRAFVTQTDARNHVNGLDSQSLATLENRMFTNEIAFVDCSGAGCSFGAGDVLDLEPGTPTPATALATPYGIAVSGDDTTLVATASGSSRVFTVDVASRLVRGRLGLDAGVPSAIGQQIPKGVALRSGPSGAPLTAYVLNSLEGTVSVVDVSNPASLQHVAKITVGVDPTPAGVRRGRIAFENAFASTNGTFSCQSCHPDSNTDQLLWRIGGDCTTCGRQDEVRSTMPVRGLKNTLPLHWDGTLGDPFGGPNGKAGNGTNVAADCTRGPQSDPERERACMRKLVDASLSGVMCRQSPSCPTGPAGLAGALTVAERDDLARMLGAVSYPPARGRPLADQVTPAARRGFADFFADFRGVGADLGDIAGVDSCADMNSGCHALPLGADTNSSTLGAFDVPTMRGMTDRFLQFSIGITNAEEVHVFAQTSGTLTFPGIPFPIGFQASVVPWDPAEGFREDVTFATAFIAFGAVYGSGPLDMFQMFEEASTGHSGAVGRQVSLTTATTAPAALAATAALLASLEAADANDLINLQGVGTRGGQTIRASYQAASNDYLVGGTLLSRSALLAEAQSGATLLTLTGFLPLNFGSGAHNQPLLAPSSTANDATLANWNPDLPILPADNPMTLKGIDVRSDAVLYMDGARVGGTIACVSGGSFAPYCSSERVRITLAAIPAGDGPHLLQIQNPKGPISAEMPLCVGSADLCND